MENESNFKIENLEHKDGKYIIPLSSPVKFGESTISFLEFVEPKAKHIKSMPSNPTTGDMLKVIGALCSQPDSVIDELSFKDLGLATSFFEAFS